MDKSLNGRLRNSTRRKQIGLLCAALHLQQYGSIFSRFRVISVGNAPFPFAPNTAKRGNAVQDLSRSIKVTNFSTSRKAIRLSTSRYQKRMHISYRLPDIQNLYVDFRCRGGGTSILNADFRCRGGGTSIERVILEKPLGTITKFGIKKIESLRYFPLTNSMAPSSAILELFASESPIFGLCTFWSPNSADVFRRWEDRSLQNFSA